MSNKFPNAPKLVFAKPMVGESFPIGFGNLLDGHGGIYKRLLDLRVKNGGNKSVACEVMKIVLMTELG